MLPWNPPASLANDAPTPQPPGPYRGNYPQLTQEQHAQQQQQQQQMHQQQQQQQQQQQPQQQQPQQPAANAPLPAQYPPMTLASTLHFLQTEHRRYARDRNEWEIERAEMRARIALLEGEKRGNEGALRDLGRRCKMLENALRGERSKFLSTTNALNSLPGHTPSPSGTSSPVQIPGPLPTGIAPAKAAFLKDGSSESSPAVAATSTSTSAPPITISAATPMPGGMQSRAQSSLSVNGGAGTWGTTASGVGMGISGAGARDPRGKARSRDYLKQCLQEITYLTSTTTLNPLSATSFGAPNLPRPRKTLPDQLPTGPLPTSILPRPAALADAPAASLATANSFELPPPHPITSFPSDPASAFVPLKRQISQPGTPSTRSIEGPQEPPFVPTTEKDWQASRTAPPSSPSLSSNKPSFAPSPPSAEPAAEEEEVPTGLAERRGSLSGPTGENDRLTAIFKPESSEAWQERLKKAGSRAYPENEGEGEKRFEDAGAEEKGEGDEALEGLEWEDEKSEDGQVWKSKRTLRSHLDSVRCVAFAQDELSLVSGSDDMTLKFWRLNPHGLNLSSRSATPETEPQMTYRGHTSSITSVLISSPQGRIYSASLDSTIKAWSIPSPTRDTYGPFDPSMEVSTFVGHLDGVWALALLGSGEDVDSLLASASADGTVKIWSTERPDAQLKLSWDYGGTEGESGGKRRKVVPTALAAVGGGRLAVAYDDSVVKVFEVGTGKELLRLQSDETYDGTPLTQINSVVAHPTLPIIATAHEDKYIRLFDSNTGACTHSFIAHLDGVTSIDIDPSGKSLVSVGHDTSIRFWDLEDVKCVQEIAAHRTKSAEGILDVKFHTTLPFVASAGADGTVKIWG